MAAQRAASWVAVAALGLSWAWGAGAQTATQQTQQKLRTTILQTLLNDPELGQYPLAASVSPDSRVVLNGVLPTKAEKDEAARLVKSIAGVKGVNNQISVDAKATPLPSAAAAPAGAARPAATPGAGPSGQDIQTAVQNALAADGKLGNVTARVANGEVVLAGTVATTKDRARAEKIAVAHADHWKVVNHIFSH